MQLHPTDRLARFPTLTHRFQLWIVLLHLRVAIHARLRVRQIGMRRDFDKTMAVATIHPQLSHVHVVRERHRLNRFVTDAGILWRYIIPRGRGQPAGDDDAGHRHLERQPVCPAWEKVLRHKISGAPCCRAAATNLETSASRN